jgi:hypothetical protein
MDGFLSLFLCGNLDHVQMYAYTVPIYSLLTTAAWIFTFLMIIHINLIMRNCNLSESANQWATALSSPQNGNYKVSTKHHKGPRPLEQCRVRSVKVCASTSVGAVASRDVQLQTRYRKHNPHPSYYSLLLPLHVLHRPPSTPE